jgi:hypothetical protein
VDGDAPPDEPAEHHEPADHGLGEDADRLGHGQPDQPAPPRADAEGGQHGQSGRDHQRDREQPVAELDPLVERGHLGVRGGDQAPREALRPGRAAQAGAGHPHDRPGDRDPGLPDHGRDRQRADQREGDHRQPAHYGV